jgi:hypothetical protein
MTRFWKLAASAGFAFACLAVRAHASSCTIVGDSVAVGLGTALGGCGVSAKVGISASAAAARVHSGGNWVVASMGSNDFPSGITSAQRAQSDARVRNALEHAYASAGGRLLLILPANGARATVASWAAQHGVPTVAFAPRGDGIHPRDYAELAQRVRAKAGL